MKIETHAGNAHVHEPKSQRLTAGECEKEKRGERRRCFGGCFGIGSIQSSSGIFHTPQINVNARKLIQDHEVLEGKTRFQHDDFIYLIH